jgi:hypothetical protein
MTTFVHKFEFDWNPNILKIYKLSINNSLTFKLKRAEYNGGVRVSGFT